MKLYFMVYGKRIGQPLCSTGRSLINRHIACFYCYYSNTTVTGFSAVLSYYFVFRH